MEVWAIARAFLAVAVLAWLPGYCLLRALSSPPRGVEAFVLAVALSVAIVSALLYAGSVLLGLPVDVTRAVLYALLVAGTAGVGRIVRGFMVAVPDR